MVGRVAYGSMIIFAVACSSPTPEDIEYPPLPDRTEPADASGDAKTAMLKAVDAGSMNEGNDPHEMPVAPSGDGGVVFPRDASIDAAIFADASMGAADAATMDAGGACDATEVEPNDVAPNQLPYGKMCGAIVGQDADRFLFRPMQKTKLSFAATSPFSVFYVGDYSGTFQQQVHPGEAIAVGPSNDAWYVVGAGPNGAGYVITAELAP